MAGLDPAIHASTAQDFEMDGRLKGGHDILSYPSSKFGDPVAKSSGSSPVYGSSSGPSSSDGLGTSKPDGGMASRKPAALSSSRPGRCPTLSSPNWTRKASVVP